MKQQQQYLSQYVSFGGSKGTSDDVNWHDANPQSVHFGYH